MTTEPLPQLTDLFIKDTTGTRPDRSEAAPSPAAAELFERFLRTAGPEGLPGPTPATARRAGSTFQRRPTGDHRPDPVERDRRAPADRRDPIDRNDRRADPVRDRDGDRDDVGRTDRADDPVEDPAEVRRTEDRRPGDAGDAGSTAESDTSEKSTATDKVTEESGAPQDSTDTEGDEAAGSAAGRAAVSPDLAELPAGAEGAILAPAVEPERVDLPADAGAVDGEVIGLVDETVEAVDREGSDGAAVDGADPTATVGSGQAALAAAVVGNELARTLDDAPADEAASAEVAGDGEGLIETIDGAEQSTGTADPSGQPEDGSTEITEASEGADPTAETSTDLEAEAAGTETRPVSTDGGAAADGAEPVPVVARPTAPSADRSTTGPTTTVGGIEAAAATGARRGPAPITAPTATAGTGPVLDGEPGEPLWLQVHRAVGSLRTLRNGEQQVTIRLRPAELGSVLVRINAGENGTAVSLLTESAIAANQLGQQRQQLVDQLEESGLRGVAVDIDTGGNPDQAEPGAEGDGDPSSADSTGPAAASAGAAGGPIDGGNGFRARRGRGSSVGLVDLDL